MSSRPTLRPVTVVNAASMAATATSLATVLQSLSQLCYTASWSGAAPAGDLSVQISNDYSLSATGQVSNSGTWATMELEHAGAIVTAIPLSGDTGSGAINLSGVAAYACRLLFTPTGAGAFTVAPVADVAGSLAGKYFLISDQAGNNSAIWFKVSGVGSAPTVAGYTAVEQDISTDDDAATIGAALATTIAALNSSNSFTTSGTSTVTVTLKVAGPWTLPTAGNSGFTVAITGNNGTLTAMASGKVS